MRIISIIQASCTLTSVPHVCGVNEVKSTSGKDDCEFIGWVDQTCLDKSINQSATPMPAKDSAVFTFLKLYLYHNQTLRNQSINLSTSQPPGPQGYRFRVFIFPGQPLFCWLTQNQVCGASSRSDLGTFLILQ